MSLKAYILKLVIISVIYSKQTSVNSSSIFKGNRFLENSTDFTPRPENSLTSETTTATSSGNNLNVINEANPLGKAAIGKFQTVNRNEKYKNDEDKKLLLLSNKNGEEIKSSTEESSNEINSMLLVLDNCLENNIKDNQRSLIKVENDMEKHDVEVPLFNYDDSSDIFVETQKKRKNSNTERRHQQKSDIHYVKMDTSTTEFNLTLVPVIPITIDLFGDVTESTKQSETITENGLKASYINDWFDQKSKTKIRFSALPHAETYLIPSLKLDQGFYPFTFVSQFFSLIYPFDFPVDLIKDIVWGKLTFPYSFIQSIKVESTFLVFIIIFTCIALITPVYLLILGILSLFSNSSCDDDTETGALYPETEDSECNDSIIIVLVLFVLLLSCLLLSSMIITNEQARLAVSEGQNIISCACADITAWLAVAAREMYHSVVPAADVVLHAYMEDLRNVDNLLGEPIQRTISSESGIDLVLDSLADLILESEDLSTKISSLRDISIRAGSVSSAASDRVKDLGRQLDNLKKHCTMKDQPLCDTINTNSLEIRMKFDLILHEQKLLELRSLGVDNMTRAIYTARHEFKALPSVISLQTSKPRQDIIQDIEKRRESVHSSSRILSDIVRHLTSSLHSAARQMEDGIRRMQVYDFWRWTFMLVCIAILGFVMVLILIALLCGCAEAKNHSKRTLQVSSVWLCFGSTVLWSMISAVFLIAGHAEVYVCHSLYDSPSYDTLSQLLDRPSPLLTDKEGIFDALFRDLENFTINVPVKDVIRECEKDSPAYTVFHLDKVLDVNKETSYFEWEELQRDFGRLATSLDVKSLKTISVYISKLLNEMLLVSDVNLAKYRVDYNGPVLGRDLPSLVDQMQNIAAQAKDLSTAGRIDTLATRAQRLHATHIKPLEQLRADMVFKLTELELQLLPFRRKLNISLSHIYTSQYYIDNQGDIIAQKKVSLYVSRLIAHCSAWRSHAITSVSQKAAKCGPLYTVYDAARHLLCTRYISSLHGWWLCGFLLGVLWCTLLLPLCVKLWRVFGWKIRTQEAIVLSNLRSGPQGTPTTALCESGNWNTPGPPPPPRCDSW